MLLQRSPHTSLRESVSAYWGYEEISDGPMRRREGPGSSVVITISLGNEWLIDGERRASFIGGLRSSQVATEHAGWSLGMQIDLVPWAAYRLLRIPMHEIAQTTVPFEQLLRGELVERLAAAPTWDDRFDLLDQMLARQLRDAPAASPEVIWAWQQLARRTAERVSVPLPTSWAGAGSDSWRAFASSLDFPQKRPRACCGSSMLVASPGVWAGPSLPSPAGSLTSRT